MYKFRTMYVGTEEKVGGRLIKNNGEGHITKVGNVLRDYKVDELPQLLNVIKGEMNIVGPRPIRPATLEEYLLDYPDYTKRFAVKPGITGLAQVNGGYYINPGDKLHFDLLYIENQSLLLDLKLVAKTGYLMVKRITLGKFHKLILKMMFRNSKKYNNRASTVLRFSEAICSEANILRKVILKDANRTIKNLKRMLKDNPSSARTNYDLGLAYKMVKQQAEAEFYFHRAAFLDSEYRGKDARNTLIIADKPKRLRHHILPNLEQHLSTNSRSVADLPSTRQVEILTNIGIIRLANGEYQQALDFFEQTLAALKQASPPAHSPNAIDALTLRRSRALVLAGLGDCYYKMGQYEQAVENYESALSQKENVENPDFIGDAPLYLKLGVTFAKSGAHAEAVEHLKQALSIDPSLSEAQALLKSLKYQLGWNTE
jgi:tetratricopeptide (TPR) repeat protein